MLIFQKNFNEPRQDFVTAAKPGEGYSSNYNLPWVTQKTTPVPPAPKTPTEEDLLQSALRKKNSISYFERLGLSPEEQAALDKHQEAQLNKTQTEYKDSTMQKVNDEAAQNTTAAANAAASSKPSVDENVSVITEKPEVEVTPELNQFQVDRKAEAAKLRAETGLVRGKAQEYLDKGRETAGKIKDSASNAWNKWSEGYGESTGRSLGTDAALAAGGLALAGGAYHLIKKRAAKKKAEKEALEARIKK